MESFFTFIDALSWPQFIILTTLSAVVYVAVGILLGKLLRRIGEGLW